MKIFFGLGLVGVALWIVTFQVPERHVGVIYRFGALQNEIILPGWTYHIPFVRVVKHVQISIQTDSIADVVCGTNNGVSMTFEKIDVVNQLPTKSVLDVVRRYGLDYDQPLIFDLIRSSVLEFCSHRSFHEVYISKFDELDDTLQRDLEKFLHDQKVDLHIVNVRFLKPKISEEMLNKYRVLQNTETSKQQAKMEHELTEQKANASNLIALLTIEQEGAKKLAEIKKENTEKLALLESARLQEMTRIESAQMQAMARIEADALQDQARISAQNRSALARLEAQIELQKGVAKQKLLLSEQQRQLFIYEAETNYTLQRIQANTSLALTLSLAEGQKALLTPQYIELKRAEALLQGLKVVYYGDKLPTVITGNFPYLTPVTRMASQATKSDEEESESSTFF